MKKVKHSNKTTNPQRKPSFNEPESVGSLLLIVEIMDGAIRVSIRVKRQLNTFNKSEPASRISRETANLKSEFAEWIGDGGERIPSNRTRVLNGIKSCNCRHASKWDHSRNCRDRQIDLKFKRTKIKKKRRTKNGSRNLVKDAFWDSSPRLQVALRIERRYSTISGFQQNLP